MGDRAMGLTKSALACLGLWAFSVSGRIVEADKKPAMRVQHVVMRVSHN
ncbi:hypothetical protein BSU04_43580 [Caballeronia sordidicola]|uniref:Uncharacterized protein n=1 Tax=Caballeronia sordidicola TaxID=196367 RepID=A0A226WLL8_CABSO|nr:hypothetical protein BSU04_43580 [Caballeronia sordidicola]